MVENSSDNNYLFTAKIGLVGALGLFALTVG
jgi:hypothetical protein